MSENSIPHSLTLMCGACPERSTARHGNGCPILSRSLRKGGNCICVLPSCPFVSLVVHDFEFTESN